MHNRTAKKSNLQLATEELTGACEAYKSAYILFRNDHETLANDVISSIEYINKRDKLSFLKLSERDDFKLFLTHVITQSLYEYIDKLNDKTFKKHISPLIIARQELYKNLKRQHEPYIDMTMRHLGVDHCLDIDKLFNESLEIYISGHPDKVFNPMSNDATDHLIPILSELNMVQNTRLGLCSKRTWQFFNESQSWRIWLLKQGLQADEIDTLVRECERPINKYLYLAKKYGKFENAGLFFFELKADRLISDTIFFISTADHPEFSRMFQIGYFSQRITAPNSTCLHDLWQHIEEEATEAMVTKGHKGKYYQHTHIGTCMATDEGKKILNQLKAFTQKYILLFNLYMAAKNLKTCDVRYVTCWDNTFMRLFSSLKSEKERLIEIILNPVAKKIQNRI